MSDIKPQIQKAQRPPRKINTKRNPQNPTLGYTNNSFHSDDMHKSLKLKGIH